MGFNSGLVVEDMHCSICGTKIALRGGCDYIVGEVYNGEMRNRMITKATLLHVSIVKNSEHRYTVIFPNGNNDRKFSLVKAIVDALVSPWHPWCYIKEERKDYHPAYQGVNPDDDRPCDSTLKYASCCLSKETVVPHFEFYMENWPSIAYQKIL